MASVTALRAHFQNYSLSGKHAVCVGATAGIGRSIAELLAERGASVTVIGRNEERGSDVLQTLNSVCPEGQHKFVRMDASLVRNAYKFADDFGDGPLDFLVLTQSIAWFQGRTETPEGLDIKLALHYYTRVAFVDALLPALEKSSDARVQFVLSAGVHSAYAGYAEDPELKENYGLKNAADMAGFYSDVACDSLAREHPKMLFIHSAPGFVATTWGSEMNFVLRGAVRFMQLFGKSSGDCATYMCKPIIGERPVEQAWYLMDEKGEPAKPTDLHDKAREFVWSHTMETIKRLH